MGAPALAWAGVPPTMPAAPARKIKLANWLLAPLRFLRRTKATAASPAEEKISRLSTVRFCAPPALGGPTSSSLSFPRRLRGARALKDSAVIGVGGAVA